jgi:betaine-aldehyde dehydrogenase
MFTSPRTHLVRGVVRRFAAHVAPPNVKLPAPKLFIDGAFVDAEGGARLPVLAPRNGQVFAELASASAADVDCAVASARRCFDGYFAGDPASWPCWPPARRAGVLRRLAQGLLGRLDEVALLESMDCGKPLADARADVASCAALLVYYADLVDPPSAPPATAATGNHSLSLQGERPVAAAAAVSALQPTPLAVPEAGVTASLVAEPLGVVGAITPWNYPLAQAVAKAAPAWAAGCCVVLKPSPLASLTCLLLAAEAVAAGLPPGALQVLTGGPPGEPPGGWSCGEALSRHGGLDKLSFTGSTEAGKRVLAASAPWVRPTTLELGGKGALLVFDDADLDAAVDWALFGEVGG